MAVTRNLKQRIVPDVISPLTINKTPMSLDELNKTVRNISLKINEIIKYINMQAQPDTIELSEADMQRKKIVVQPSDLLAVFANKSNMKANDPDIKSEIDVMEEGVKKLKESLGADNINDVVDNIVKEDKSHETKKKKKKKGSFYY